MILHILGVSSVEYPKLEWLELIKASGEVISAHGLLQDPLKKTIFYIPLLRLPATAFQVKVSDADTLLGRSCQRLNRDVYDVESFSAKAYLKTIVGSTYTIQLDMNNYNDQKQRPNLKVKTCKDFNLNSFYNSFNILMDGYDSLHYCVRRRDTSSNKMYCRNCFLRTIYV
jgi:hypothetical protein